MATWCGRAPSTFVASASCALLRCRSRFRRHRPSNVQHERRAFNGEVGSGQKAGRLPKVVIPVHLCGQACEMAAIHALGEQYGFKIVEDAAHAIGAR